MWIWFLIDTPCPFSVINLPRVITWMPAGLGGVHQELLGTPKIQWTCKFRLDSDFASFGKSLPVGKSFSHYCSFKHFLAILKLWLLIRLPRQQIKHLDTVFHLTWRTGANWLTSPEHGTKNRLLAVCVFLSKFSSGFNEARRFSVKRNGTATIPPLIAQRQNTCLKVSSCEPGNQSGSVDPDEIRKFVSFGTVIALWTFVKLICIFLK